MVLNFPLKLFFLAANFIMAPGDNTVAILTNSYRELYSKLENYDFKISNIVEEDSVKYYDSLFMAMSSLAYLIKPGTPFKELENYFGRQPDQVCISLDSKCSGFTLMPGIQLPKGSDSNEKSDVIYVKYFFLADGSSFLFFKVKSSKEGDFVSSYGWKSILTEYDQNKLVELSSTFKLLKEKKGHFDGEDFDQSIDSFGYEKWSSMEELRQILGRPGIKIDTIEDYMGRCDGFTVNLDQLYQTPGFAPDAPSPDGEEYTYMFYKWRGEISFLYFRINSNTEEVATSGWKQIALN